MGNELAIEESAIELLQQQINVLQTRVETQELIIRTLQQQSRQTDELLLAVHVLVEKKASNLLDELTRHPPDELEQRCMDVLYEPTKV